MSFFLGAWRDSIWTNYLLSGFCIGSNWEETFMSAGLQIHFCHNIWLTVVCYRHTDTHTEEHLWRVKWCHVIASCYHLQFIWCGNSCSFELSWEGNHTSGENDPVFKKRFDRNVSGGMRKSVMIVPFACLCVCMDGWLRYLVVLL